MGKLTELTNDSSVNRFGKLTVIRKSDKRYTDGTFLHECKCDCGNTSFKLLRSLKKGDVKSCGCLGDPSTNIESTIGKKFNRITITGFKYKRNNKNYWEYKCECGEGGVVQTREFTTKSCCKCGYNKVQDLTGMTFGELTVVSRTKKKIQNQPHWDCVCSCGKRKIAVTADLKNGKVKSCGHLVTIAGQNNAKKALAGQSNINGTNLYRISPNRKIQRNNKSGVIGVYQVKKTGKWVARLQLRGKTVYFKYFDNKTEAIEARRSAEMKFYAPVLEKYKKSSANS